MRDRIKGLYERYGPDVHRYFLKKIRAGEDAADLSQEVFYRVTRWSRPEAFREPMAYLYAVATQVLRQSRLGQGRLPLSYDSDLADKAAAAGAGVDLSPSICSPGEAERDVKSLMAKLNKIERKVVLLHKRDKYSVPEIAAETGLPLHTVRRHLTRANAKLDKVLRQGDVKP